MKIQQAHQFPVTSLKFNPTTELLISGSADNSIKIIIIPPVGQRGSFPSSFFFPFFELEEVLMICENRWK